MPSGDLLIYRNISVWLMSRQRDIRDVCFNIVLLSLTTIIYVTPTIYTELGKGPVRRGGKGTGYKYRQEIQNDTTVSESVQTFQD